MDYFVTSFFSADAKYFSIGNETGELKVERINRDLEQNEFYQFTVRLVL